jgi:hypothetical protein
MLWSVRASVKPMPESRPCLLLRRAFSRLLESTPNYVEVTAVLAVALIGRILLLPNLWKGGSQACVAAALLVAVFYLCLRG